jgi:uncharacterized protein (TIGR03083 family)
MDIFDEIADERREVADLAAGLTDQQLTTPSLCGAWTVHDVVGHLVVPLETSLPKFAVAMVASRGSFDRANDRLAREQGRRPVGDLVEVLRRKAGSRFTPPGHGPEAPLTDLVVHGLDIRRPLGVPRQVPTERLRAALAFAIAHPSIAGLSKDALDGFRLEADDLDWSHGTGSMVSGSAEALLLAVTGRPVGLEHLRGAGVATLRDRLV